MNKSLKTLAIDTLQIELLKAHAACLRSVSESYQIESQIEIIQSNLAALTPEEHDGHIGIHLRQATSSLTIALNDKKEEYKTWATIHDMLKL